VQARGNLIRRQRERCGFGLTAFALRIGISPAWLSRIERDQGNPSPDVLKRIALTLHREREARDAIAAITHTEDEGSDERDNGD
jgi:transcriptional regulator with XRE-family HTH domain